MFNRFAPSLDPSLTIKLYERTPEQQASLGYLVDASPQEKNKASVQINREPHGLVGAATGHLRILEVTAG